MSGGPEKCGKPRGSGHNPDEDQPPGQPRGDEADARLSRFHRRSSALSPHGPDNAPLARRVSVPIPTDERRPPLANGDSRSAANDASGHEQDTGGLLLSVKVRIGSRAKRTQERVPRTRYPDWSEVQRDNAPALFVEQANESRRHHALPHRSRGHA